VGNRKGQSILFRAIVLGCGTLMALFFSMVFVPKVVSVLRGTAPELPAEMRWEGQIMIAMFVIFMLGYLAGWLRSLWGGMLMIVAALLVSIPLSLQGNYGSLIFGVPQLVIGILYIMLSRAEKTYAPGSHDWGTTGPVQCKDRSTGTARNG
jgi:hypothetical protein